MVLEHRALEMEALLAQAVSFFTGRGAHLAAPVLHGPGHHLQVDARAVRALAVVAAYAPLNDVTARDLQRLDVQFTRAKGYDTFCPVGAQIPADGIDWRELEITCRVDGSERQRSRGATMIFGVPYLVSYRARPEPPQRR